MIRFGGSRSAGGIVERFFPNTPFPYPQADMVTTATRQASIERRKALSSAGKSAASRYAKTRQRNRSDRSSASAVAPGSRSAAARTTALREAAQQTSRPTSPPGNAERRPLVKLDVARHKVSNPSRELVLARRRALTTAGKRADTSKDRIRSATRSPAPATAARQDPATEQHQCNCKQRQNRNTSSLLTSLPSGTSRRAAAEARLQGPKAKNSQSSSRSLVLARRLAMSKHGKAANAPTNVSSAAVARQGNPELSGRELAQRMRELKARSGAASQPQKGNCKRPCGPRRGINRPVEAVVVAAADASWKVGASQTTTGQTVTGTRTDRSTRTTGNEASTCRTITGTQYMGADVFQSYCHTPPAASPRKVAVTPTGYGNTVTGTEVGRSPSVTGDEPGTCKSVTGTQYLRGDHGDAWCDAPAAPQPRKVGLASTVGNQRVSGTLVGRSARVTGDEPGSGRQLTGTQYMATGAEAEAVGRGPAPAKVRSFATLAGVGVTGTEVGRSAKVTGDEPGTCKAVTGDDYVGRHQYEAFCGGRPAPEAAKVGFSATNRQQVVSGTNTGRSERVTGDEPGTCKAVTGTPYAGLEQVEAFCSTDAQQQIVARTPVAAATPAQPMTGLQPGIGGVMTGAERGACEPITGTPYVGADHYAATCSQPGTPTPDFPQPLDGAPWTRFSVASPFRAAQQAAHAERQQQHNAGVTGTLYEHGPRITGPFGMAGGRVTGTEEFRFDRHGHNPQVVAPAAARRHQPQPLAAPASAHNTEATANRQPPTPPAPSRVTGEGMAQGVRISGDDWGRNSRVTGTEGPSSRRRNPSRPGPMSAMPSVPPKRNEAFDVPLSPITGSSGNTEKGALVTFSGGARG